MTAVSPAVCVVVSTYDRPDMLRRLVDALQSQDHPDYEVVIVDNGSDARTHRVLSEGVAHRAPGRFRTLRIDQNRGPATARNMGWRSTDAAVVAFTDDDCVPTSSWLRELCAAAPEGTIVQGQTIPDGDMTAARPWSKSQNIRGFTQLFETCNLLVPRSVLEDLDGFDEQFPVAAGEDTDLGWRALARGVPTAFAPSAVVRHVIWDRSFMDHLRERPRWANTALVVKRNPGVRVVLTAGFLYRPDHALILAGVPVTVALVASGRWAVAMVGLAGVVAARTARTWRRYGVAGAAVRALQRLIASSVEVVLFAQASVRHRTLLL